MIISRTRSELAEKYGISNDELREISLSATSRGISVDRYMRDYFGYQDPPNPVADRTRPGDVNRLDELAKAAREGEK